VGDRVKSGETMLDVGDPGRLVQYQDAGSYLNEDLYHVVHELLCAGNELVDSAFSFLYLWSWWHIFATQSTVIPRGFRDSPRGWQVGKSTICD
jgi:hypothetical protein